MKKYQNLSLEELIDLMGDRFLSLSKTVMGRYRAVAVVPLVRGLWEELADTKHEALRKLIITLERKKLMMRFERGQKVRLAASSKHPSQFTGVGEIVGVDKHYRLPYRVKCGDVDNLYSDEDLEPVE